MKIFRLSGTQVGVASCFGFDDFWSEPDAPEKNEKQIQLDIFRRLYVHREYSHFEFQSRWEEAARQDDYGYQQDNMTGGGIVELVISEANASLEIPQEYINFSFCYIDDHGVLCSLSLVFFENDPARWMLGILKNAAAPHNESGCEVYLQGFQYKEKEMVVSQAVGLEKLINSTDSDSINELLKHCFDKKSHRVVESFVRACLEATDDKSEVATPEFLVLTYQKSKLDQYKKDRIDEELEPASTNRRRSSTVLSSPRVSREANALSLFSMAPHFPRFFKAEEKIKAAQKLGASIERRLDQLAGGQDTPEVEFEPRERAATNEGRLGDIAKLGYKR